MNSHKLDEEIPLEILNKLGKHALERRKHKSQVSARLDHNNRLRDVLEELK